LTPVSDQKVLITRFLLLKPFTGFRIVVVFILLCSLNIISPSSAFGQEKVDFSGVILDSLTHSPIEMAVVSVQDVGRWAYTDNNGRFELDNLPVGEYVVGVHYLGYHELKKIVTFHQNVKLVISLQAENLELNEVIVTATEKRGGPTSSVINRQAMEHLQPSGFADLLELLPGYMATKLNMSEVSTITLRQAGSDKNTGLGTAFYIDGVPFDNDASLQLAGNSSSDLKISGRINVAKGVDMRQISTDDVEKIEIVRGVPSARYGGITSGAVLITRKWGETDLTARFKSDLNSKLASVGKGFKIRKLPGIFNVNTEFMTNSYDPRNTLLKYSRSTTSLKYIRHFDWNGTELILKTSGSYLFTLDKEKEDPEINYGQKDLYKSTYSRYSFGVNADLMIPGNVSKELKFTFSSSLVDDEFIREKYVSPTGPMPIPTAMVEGEADAEYLQQGYEGHLLVDGKPVNIYATTDFSLSFSKNNMTHKPSAGFSWKFDKNYGDGEVYDLSKPLYPGSSNWRPRPFSDVPAMNKLAFYLEDDFTFKSGRHTVLLIPGVRGTSLASLSNAYAMQGKVYFDPRINAEWRFPAFNLGQLPLKITLTGAWGKLSRMPVAWQLYPDLEYYDIIELNYYSQNPDLRRLYVMTQIEDHTNYNLKPAETRKKEVGIKASVGKAKLSLTAFDEKMTNGFLFSKRFVSYTYKKYDAGSVSPEGLSAPPDLSLFDYDQASELFEYKQSVNGALVRKKGIEYRLELPRWKALNSKVTIDGAWFKTRYFVTLPSYKLNNIIVNNEIYPYVGVYLYDSTKSNVKELHNTNLYWTTNIPRHKLVMTLSLQATWYFKTRYIPYDGVPDGYLDTMGNYHVFQESDVDDPVLRYLVKNFSDHYFDTSRKPIDFGLNLKMSKDISEHLKLSFYVNRLVSYLPDYKTNFNVTKIRKRNPWFGMELKLKL
jgi:hypothetical protein